jgi:hypothetical protein
MKSFSLYCYVTYNLVYDSVNWKILNLIQNPFLHSIKDLTDDSIYNSIYHLIENPFGNSIGRLTQKMIEKLNEND